MKKIGKYYYYVFFNLIVIPGIITFLTLCNFVYDALFYMINILIILLYILYLIYNLTLGRILPHIININYETVCKLKMAFFIFSMLFILILPILLNLGNDYNFFKSLVMIIFSLWPLILIFISGLVFNYFELKK